MANQRPGDRDKIVPPDDGARVQEDPTEPIAEEPTDPIRLNERTQPGMPDLTREEPTVPREAPTLPWSQAQPWGGGEPDVTAPRKDDPLFLPAVVFVMVMLTCIGLFVYTQTRKPVPIEDSSLAAPPPPVATVMPSVVPVTPAVAIPPAVPAAPFGASAGTSATPMPTATKRAGAKP